MGKLPDKLVNKLIDRFFRALPLYAIDSKSQTLGRRIDLDNTMLGKPDHLAMHTRTRTVIPSNGPGRAKGGQTKQMKFWEPQKLRKPWKSWSRRGPEQLNFHGSPTNHIQYDLVDKDGVSKE